MKSSHREPPLEADEADEELTSSLKDEELEGQHNIEDSGSLLVSHAHNHDDYRPSFHSSDHKSSLVVPITNPDLTNLTIVFRFHRPSFYIPTINSDRLSRSSHHKYGFRRRSQYYFEGSLKWISDILIVAG